MSKFQCWNVYLRQLSDHRDGLSPIIVALTEKLHSGFEQLGISIDDNPILQRLFSRTQVEDQKIKQQFQLFLMDLFLGLKRIQEADLKSFSYYVQRINATQGKANFWGEHFEVYNHHKLLIENGKFIKNLRRGIEGEEPEPCF